MDRCAGRMQPHCADKSPDAMWARGHMDRECAEKADRVFRMS